MSYLVKLGTEENDLDLGRHGIVGAFDKFLRSVSIVFSLFFSRFPLLVKDLSRKLTRPPGKTGMSGIDEMKLTRVERSGQVASSPALSS
jgi:hypothetical protein